MRTIATILLIIFGLLLMGQDTVKIDISDAVKLSNRQLQVFEKGLANAKGPVPSNTTAVGYSTGNKTTFRRSSPTNINIRVNTTRRYRTSYIYRWPVSSVGAYYIRHSYP